MTTNRTSKRIDRATIRAMFAEQKLLKELSRRADGIIKIIEREESACNPIFVLQLLESAAMLLLACATANASMIERAKKLLEVMENGGEAI